MLKSKRKIHDAATSAQAQTSGRGSISPRIAERILSDTPEGLKKHFSKYVKSDASQELLNGIPQLPENTEQS